MTAPKPMTAARFRRLMASAEMRAATDAQGITEAEARGRQAGLLLVSGLPHDDPTSGQRLMMLYLREVETQRAAIREERKHR